MVRNHKCLNSKERITYEVQIIRELGGREVLPKLILEEMKQVTAFGEEYCELHCPIGRYYRRLEKSLEDNLIRLRRAGFENGGGY